MGPDQLGGVMETIARGAAARAGREVKEEELRASADSLAQSVREDSSPYRTSAHLLDDGIIDPRDTRDVLGMCLEVVTIDPIEGNPGFRGLARI
jgi:acetyl-CoA carboxylase carboxyltransferase component